MAFICAEVSRLEAAVKEQDDTKYGGTDDRHEDRDSADDADSETNGEESQTTGKSRQQRGAYQGPNTRVKRQCKGQ